MRHPGVVIVTANQQGEAMDINEIENLIYLLEEEDDPTSHGGWLRLRKDAMALLIWLPQDTLPLRQTWQDKCETEQELELRINVLLRRADLGLGQYTARPKLCLNAPQ